MIQKTISLLFIIVLITACSDKKPLQWEEDVAKLTGKNLSLWLRNAPFDNQFQTQSSKNQLVITNFEQVFPFMGNFKNFNLAREEEKVYQQTELVYEDSHWGNSFVYGLLMYEPINLELDHFYSVSGNPVFSGTDSINERYTASLYKTQLQENNDSYNAAVYLVNSGYREFLFGFYQRGQLVVEFGFQINDKDPEEVIKHLKKINSALKLNVPKWASASEDQLMPPQRKVSSSTSYETPAQLETPNQ